MTPARLFAAGILMAGLLTAQALGQNGGSKSKPDATKRPKADVHVPHHDVKLDESMVEILKKKARDFKAHQAIDPKTKKPLPASHQVTLPTGKKMAAKAYVEKLNKFEKELNAIGHSLHDKAERVELAKTRVKTADLDKMAKSIAAQHKPFDPKTMKQVVNREQLHKAFQDRSKAHATRAAALRKHLGGNGKAAPRSLVESRGPTAGTLQPFHKELGNRKIAAIVLDAKLETKGSKQGVSVQGDASADAFLIGRQISLLRASSSVNMPEKGDGRARVTISIGGRTVFNKEVALKENFTKKDELSKSFDQGVSFRFALGPIPMSVKLGARGSAGIRYFIGTHHLAAEAQFVPFARVVAYAECTVDLVVAKGGARADLKLLDFELRAGGSLAVKVDPSKGLLLEEHAYISSNLEMLSGQVVIVAEINLLFTKKHFEKTLWKFAGFKKSLNLLNVNRTIPLPS
jgi:hypothetical protein